jgi:hypothetical protein
LPKGHLHLHLEGAMRMATLRCAPPSVELSEDDDELQGLS